MSILAQVLSNQSGKPVVALAPMSGVSDLGMRRAAASLGASFVVSEMVDADFYTRGDLANRIKADGKGLALHIVQIAGCLPQRLGEAARLAEAEGADVIDINMGCPAKKVVGGLAGSALMRDLDKATALIRATIGAVSVPVTVKMRLGWDEGSLNAPELARRAEAEGVAMIAVHGRTRSQFYRGRADWTLIGAVKDAVTIPVIANGDCGSLADAREMLAKSRADGIMIGRAAVGRPWLLGEIAAALAGVPIVPPSSEARARAAIDHVTTLLSLLGADLGLRHARKHLAGYAAHAGFSSTSRCHRALVTSESADRVLAILAELFTAPPVETEVAA